MFSESAWRYKVVPVVYSDGSKDFELEFRVAIRVDLLKITKSLIVSFIGEPILHKNSDRLDEENVFHTYVSMRDKIKTAAVSSIREEYRQRGIFIMVPQYN